MKKSEKEEGGAKCRKDNLPRRTHFSKLCMEYYSDRPKNGDQQLEIATRKQGR